MDPPIQFFPNLKKNQNEEKIIFKFWKFAIARPVCTTYYHKELQPAIQNAK